ncbi:MAG: UDP-N-acetylmuramate dehydrogenase [Planctomycetota bacterium]
MLPTDWRRRFRGRWSRDRPLAPCTTWRIGGPAQLYFEPAGVLDLARTVRMLRRIGAPWRILGGGSNLLVSDGGVAGAVVSLARLRTIRRAGERVEADAGARLADVVRFCAGRGLGGLEPLAGIPGSVGGAVFGNAGSRHGAIGHRVRALDLLTPQGEVERRVPGEGFFGYRSSGVGDAVVLRVELDVAPAAVGDVCLRTREIVRERNRSQPGWVGNAGCVFRNPAEGSAGRLIDRAGCKGMRAGGVRVSRRHANFFQNEGDGTAEQVERLIDRVRDRVRRACGIELELEVRRWG